MAVAGVLLSIIPWRHPSSDGYCHLRYAIGSLPTFLKPLQRRHSPRCWGRLQDARCKFCFVSNGRCRRSGSISWRKPACRRSKLAFLQQQDHTVRYPLHFSCGRRGHKNNVGILTTATILVVARDRAGDFRPHFRHSQFDAPYPKHAIHSQGSGAISGCGNMGYRRRVSRRVVKRQLFVRGRLE